LLNSETYINQPLFLKPQLNEFANGDWLLSGNYSNGDFYFNDSISNYFNNTSSTEEGFIIKFDNATQQVEWTNEVVGNSHLTATEIAPNGNTYIFGDYNINNTVSLGSKMIQGDANANSSDQNIFIGIIDTNGVELKLEKLLIDSTDYIEIKKAHIGADAYYITGTCQGTVSFNNTNYANINGANGALNESWMFIAKYDLNTDTLIWLKNTISTDNVYLQDVTFDGNENIYLTGRGVGYWSFDGVNVNTAGSFITQYDSMGNLVCVNPYNYDELNPIQNISVTSNGTLVGLKGDGNASFGSVEIFKHTNCQFSSIDTFLQGLCYFSTENQLQNNNVKVFPNPTSDNITIEFLDKITPKNAFCKVFTTDGKLVFEKQLTNFQEQLSISELPKGMYWVQIFTDNEVMTEKILKL